MTDSEIATFFGIKRHTLYLWDAKYPDFKTARETDGGEAADRRVEKSLFHRAVGFDHETEKIFMDRDGKIVRAVTVTRYPPDTMAANLWLVNRRPDRWKRNINEAGDASLNIRITGGLPDGKSDKKES